MANQIHRLQVDGELHRPERSGFGNPNTLELTFVEDGQYFQDETTGSIYRYNGDSNEWELLVGYDRGTQRITNIGAQTVDGKIGELTASAGIAPPDSEEEGTSVATGQQNIIVTELTANLYVPVAEGDELKLISSEDQSVERYVTVVQGAASGGEVTIDIQDDLFRQYFPIGSHIILDGAQFEAKFSVDPTRITLKVNEERELSEFGTLVPPNGTSTTIGENLDVGFEGPELEIASTNVSADNPVRVVAGEKIQVYEPFIDGETRVQEFTVAEEGGGTFTSSPFVIPVEETSFTQVFTTRALVREPAFSSSSRISVLSDEIVLKVDSNGNIAAITLSGNADDGSQITIVADDVDINNINFNKENGTIGSNNYVEDVSGWQIEGNGDAEFNSVKIRNGSIINSIDISSFTDGNTGIQIVDTLPASGEEGSTVFLTTDSKLYRWTGSAWTAAVPTVDLVGQITETQISNDSISTPKLQANAVTSNEISANAVTANELAANSVTSDKIVAGAITAAKIGANEVTADKIFVNNLASINSSTGNLSVSGELTMSSGSITNSTDDFTINSSGLTLATRTNVSGASNSAIKFGNGSIYGSLTDQLLPGGPTDDLAYSDTFNVETSDVLVLEGNKGSTALNDIYLVGDVKVTGTISGNGSGLTGLPSGGGGDITAVNAGTGLDGGGTSGDVTLSVDVSDFMTNGSNNRIVTATGADGMNAESNLTYDGSVMTSANGHFAVDRSTTNFSVVEGLDSNNDGIAMGIDGNGWFYLAPYQSGSKNFNRELRWHGSNDAWQVDDDFTVFGTFSNPSDQRYKENIEPLENSLDNLMQMQTIKYDMKDFLPEDERRMIGVFAQEVEQFYPEAVKESTITDDDGNERELKTVSYTQLVPVLIDAIKELKQQNEELKTRIEALEQQS